MLLLVAFGINERHAAEPILPGWVLRRRVLNGTSLASLTVGMLLIGLTSYIPLFVQSVLGHNALVGRVRAGRPDRRLADLGLPVGRALPADRLPQHRPDRRRLRGRRYRVCCCCSARKLQSVEVALTAS